jgi:hypothetical protein
MKKIKIFVIMRISFVMIVMISLILPNIIAMFPENDQIDQQNTEVTSAWGFGPHLMFAQSFEPTMQTLTRVELEMLRTHDFPDNESFLILSIRDSLDGEDLTSVIIDTNSLPYWDFQWIEFDFPNLNVSIENKYYIVISTVTKGWAYMTGSYSNPYENGEGWYQGKISTSRQWKTLSGSGEDNNWDWCFKTYGY